MGQGARNKGQRTRRGIAGAAALLAGAAIWYFVPRLGVRSPAAIVVVCATAILAMKLIEHRVRRWFRRWEERTAARGREAEGRQGRPHA